MQINIIAVGKKMPAWITDGYNEYAQRMPKECSTRLIEVNAEKRHKNSVTKDITRKEAERILSALPKNSLIITLDVTGQSWSTEQLAVKLESWRHSGRDVTIIIGGPDGIDGECRKRAELSWSLSPLTLPHPLVRLLLSEQLYRAWTILQNHPYHRGG